jgi:hypothetical protein
MKRVNTIDAISAACAAYRINGDRIVLSKTSGVTPNRDLIKSYFNDNALGLTVLDSDVEKANGLVTFLQYRYTLSAVTSRPLPDFAVHVNEIINAEVIPFNRIGIVQWIPRFTVDLETSEDVRNQLSMLSYSSKYLGRPGQRVEIEFVTITKRYNTVYQAWRYTGHDNHGNLVGFLSSVQYNEPTLKLNGNIKRTLVSKFSEGGKTTFLNQVKVLS